MKKYFIVLLFFCFQAIFPQNQKIQLVNDLEGYKLLVDEKQIFIQGMNWDYHPIGMNYEFNFWIQPDDFIEKILDIEMQMLQKIRVNAIRVYIGIPKKWIEYIYEKYNIYTMLNHSFGRYGLNINNSWVANTDYADENTRRILLEETQQLALDYRNTKGLLLFLLGNENNYGLFWQGAATEHIPVDYQNSDSRAEALYKLFDEAVLLMKKNNPQYPIAICNGDLQFLDLIASACKHVDILGINVYRGISFNDMFERVKKEFGKPILLTEFGADAYHDVLKKEDQQSQAEYLKNNWFEVYDNAAGHGKSENTLGGFTFQFSDGWWKYGQTFNLDVHDTHASWANGGYKHDFLEGQNNMNEEWFGICSKKPIGNEGNYVLEPRAAYYLLSQIHQYNPTDKKMNARKLKKHFKQISISSTIKKAKKSKN